MSHLGALPVDLAQKAIELAREYGAFQPKLELVRVLPDREVLTLGGRVKCRRFEINVNGVRTDTFADGSVYGQVAGGDLNEAIRYRIELLEKALGCKHERKTITREDDAPPKREPDEEFFK